LKLIVPHLSVYKADYPDKMDISSNRCTSTVVWNNV